MDHHINTGHHSSMDHHTNMTHHTSMALIPEDSEASLGLSSPSHSLASVAHYTPVPASRRATGAAGARSSRKSKRPSHVFEVCASPCVIHTSMAGAMPA
jgi:hypothetical protein